MNATISPSRNEIVNMSLLAVDWGRRRIGLAVKPAGQDWALPREVLTVNDEADAVEKLRGAIRESNPQGVVVGLPIDQNTSMAKEVRRFCRKTREGITGVRWFFIDERLTSQAAESMSTGARGEATDDLAAKLILETFVQSCR